MSKNDPQSPAFASLVRQGHLSATELATATAGAAARQLPLARILHGEYHLPRPLLLAALSDYFGCPALAYDERLPIPPTLLHKVSAPQLLKEGWFPVIEEEDGAVVIIAPNPADPNLKPAVAAILGAVHLAIRVTFPDDLAWFIQDFLHAPPGELIGTERTGLAFWRNTMANWRTSLACYRTDLAKARTSLAIFRTGLALATLADTLLRNRLHLWSRGMAYCMVAVGTLLVGASVPYYLRIRQFRLPQPKNQTLVEVTAATLHFLESFHFPAQAPRPPRSKETMLARLGDFLADYSTICYPVPASRERTHLARERNVLAAQRTIAACYRTLYARARTGLAFIRTGISCFGIGVGLSSYFGLGVSSYFDGLLVLVGVLMIIDGLRWYLPVRREQAELPPTRSAVLDCPEDWQGA